jgi:NAD(P)-dependent dehydrogenase (short-subunit alcohol dehydrogenase family)
MTEAGLLSGRVALVTGASRGIGRAAALALSEAGAHVILVARGVGELEEVDDQIKKNGGEATLVPLDLKDFDGLDRMGAAIFERWGKLDALLGNAGVLGPLTPIAHLQPKTWDEILAVNVTANLRLIRSCDPLLKRSDAARAVFISSGAARKSTPFWGGYAASKAALESLVLSYANECAGTNVQVNLFNPGATRTKMRAQAMPGEDPMSLPAPEDIAPQIVELLLPSCTRTGERITAVR